MIDERDVDRLAAAARVLAPSDGAYIDEDFIMNLLETVLDYMLQTEVVIKALKRFRENRWREIRTPRIGRAHCLSRSGTPQPRPSAGDIERTCASSVAPRWGGISLP